MVPGVTIERFEAPVVEDEEIDPGKALHARGDTPITFGIAFGKGQLIDQPQQPGVENRTVVAARLVAKRAGQPTLADPSRPDKAVCFQSESEGLSL